MDARRSLLNWLDLRIHQQSTQGTFMIHMAKNISPSGRASSVFPLKPISMAHVTETMDLVMNGFEIHMLKYLKLDPDFVNLVWSVDEDEHEVYYELKNETSGPGNKLLARINFPKGAVEMGKLRDLLTPTGASIEEGSPWFE